MESGCGSVLLKKLNVKAAQQAQATRGKPMQEVYEAEMLQIPQLAALGKLWKSTSTEASDKETEYVVTCVKHVFEKHIVFQFNILSTMADQFLKNVRVSLDAEDGPMEALQFVVTIASKEVKLRFSLFAMCCVWSDRWCVADSTFRPCATRCTSALDPLICPSAP